MVGRGEERIEDIIYNRRVDLVLDKCWYLSYAFYKLRVVIYMSIFIARFNTLQLLKNMEKLIDMLEDSDDVQNVWHNWDNDWKYLKSY